MTDAERLARLETRFDAMLESQHDTKRKVDEMHAAFLQMKGARWAVVALWVGLGVAVANMKWLLAALGVKFN